jgi:hypothetical protein
VTIADGKFDEARKALEEQVLPMVKSAPGAIAGYWLAPEDGHGWSIVLFETEEQARQTAPPAGSHPTEFATVDRVDFREVVANF